MNELRVWPKFIGLYQSDNKVLLYLSALAPGLYYIIHS